MAAETGALTPNLIPVDFIERLLPEFLLQPDSDFTFARWFYSAMMAKQLGNVDGFDLYMLQFKDGRSTGGGMASNMDAAMSLGLGGPLALSGLSYPDFINIVIDPTKARGGMTLKINRPKFLTTVDTESSRRLDPSQPLFGTTGQTPDMEQATVTLYEYGGPTNSAGTMAPINVAEFTQTLSGHDLVKYTGMLMRRDRWKFINSLIMTKLIASATGTQITRPQGIAANTNFTGANNEPLAYETITRATEQLRDRGIPGIPEQGNRYVGVFDHHQLTDLKNDDTYQRLAVFEPQLNPLFPGYVRTVEDVIVCATNSMTRLTDLGSSANITGYQALLVGAGVLGHGCAKPATPLRDKNDDGGRFNRFAWNAIEGTEVLDSRFTQKIITD